MWGLRELHDSNEWMNGWMESINRGWRTVLFTPFMPRSIVDRANIVYESNPIRNSSGTNTTTVHDESVLLLQWPKHDQTRIISMDTHNRITHAHTHNIVNMVTTWRIRSLFSFVFRKSQACVGAEFSSLVFSKFFVLFLVVPLPYRRRLGRTWKKSGQKLLSWIWIEACSTIPPATNSPLASVVVVVVGDL